MMAEYESEKENEFTEGNIGCGEGPFGSFAEEDHEIQHVSQQNAKTLFDVAITGFEELTGALKSLPLSILTDKQRKSLGDLLDRRRPLGGDFEDLAGNLFPDLNSDKLCKIEKQKKPTVYLLKKYENEKKNQATIFRLVEIAYSMRRADVVKVLLDAAKGYVEKPNETRGFLSHLKRKFFQDDDTISIDSVMSTTSSFSLASISSYQSYTSFGSMESFNGNIEVPLKQSNFSNAKETIMPEQNNRNNIKGQIIEGQPSVFIVSASDEKDNVIKLVKWFRKKGVNATSIETSKLDYEESPSRYVKVQLENADNVLIICSQRLKSILDHKARQLQSKGDAQVVQYLFDYLNNEVFCNLSSKSKYIPLVADKQSMTSGKDSVIPMPLSLPEAYYFENKGSRQDLLRRLYKKEKYKLPPIGNRPIIRQNVITGELIDLQK